MSGVFRRVPLEKPLGRVCARPPRFLAAYLAFAIAVSGAFAIYQEKQYYLDVPEAARPLEGLLPQKGIGNTGAYLKINSKYRHISHEINFDTREVAITEYFKIEGSRDSQAVWNNYYQELNTYSIDMNELALRKLWLNEFIGKGAAAAGGSNNILDLELPWKVPDWMKRIGVDKPRLQMNGSYKLIVSGTSERASNLPKGGTWFPDLNLDQQPAFSVKGSIGRLINVEINSEEGFGTSLQDQLKVTYKGEGDELEDDIIQEIEVGNTSISLKGTSLTGYTENHKGIFGVKMRMRFGDLEVTAVASQEGSSQEKQTLGGGAELRDIVIDDKNMSLYKHFFLSLKDRQEYSDSTVGIQTEAYKRKGYQYQPVVYMSVDATEEDKGDLDSAVAVVIGEDYQETELKEASWWKVLDDKEFNFNPELRMLTVNGGTRGRKIAVRWEGDPLKSKDRKRNLVLLYSPTIRSPLLDRLMWRNVYNIGIVAEKDREQFRLSVVDADSQPQSGGSISYRRRLGLEKIDGLDSTKQELNVNNNLIFDFNQGLLILPCFSNAYGLSGDAQHCFEPLKRINPNTKLYDVDLEEISTLSTNFRLVATNRQLPSTFSVRQNSHSVSGQGCIDITPGTEKVMMGSVQLEKDQDYEVLYELGQITLTSLRAKIPNNTIEITYECKPIFQIQDKILLGSRLEYKLDNISDESILGMTLLYKSQSTTQERPELGREPFNQFLWGFNSLLTGNPNWMTRLVNHLPLVQTEAESKVKFEYEVAQSRYNPNTKDEAYLDDFESSKTPYSFPMQIDSWTQASAPGGTEKEATYVADLDYRHQGEFIWHSNLAEDYSRIYGSTGFSTSDTRRQSIMKFIFKPNDNLLGKSWGGVMFGMNSSLFNQSRKRTLEVVLRGREGKFNIDLGEISEDLSISGKSPNGELNSEVKPGDLVNVNDAGLDNTVNLAEKGFKWECRPDCYQTPVLTGDPSFDNFNKNERKTGNSNPSYQINGTEGNNEGSIYRYDTEDLDRSGVLETRNRFVRYSISLDSACSFKNNCQELQFGWRKYQIPLYESGNVIDENNSTDIANILSTTKIVRLWVGDMPARVALSEIYLARLALVGNTWEASNRNQDYESDLDRFASGDLGDSNFIAIPPVLSDSNRLSVEVIDKREDKFRYQQSPSIKVERDTRTDEPLPERSLVLKYDNLHPGEEVSATRTLSGETKDLTMYQRILLDIHPDSTKNINRTQNRVSIAFQFGRDRGDKNSDNYYEIKVHLAKVPDDKDLHRNLWIANSISVPLKEISALKISEDSLYELRRYASRKIAPPEGGDSLELSVVGEPSLSQISWMRLVIMVDDTAGSKQSGEIWVNDLRLEGVSKSFGTAMRSSLQLDFADFLTLSGQAQYRNGDFTTMSETKKTPAQSVSQVNYDANIILSANKFLPDAWGVGLPLSLSYKGSLNRPFVKPNSDVILEGHDFNDIFHDLIDDNLSTAEGDTSFERSSRYSRAFQSTFFQQKFTTNYTKQRRTDNLFLRALVERPELSYSVTNSEKIDIFSQNYTWVYSTRLTYDLSPQNNRSYKPFAFSEKWKYMPKAFSGFDVTPLPDKVNLTLADLTYSRNHEIREPQRLCDLRNELVNYDVQMSHGADMEYRPFSFLGLSYRLGVNRDFDPYYQSFDRNNLFDASSREGFLASNLIFDLDPRRPEAGTVTQEQYEKYRKYGFLASERSREQSFNMDFNPNLLTWLSSSFNFSSTYNHTKRDSVIDLFHSPVPAHYIADYGHDAKFSLGLRLPNAIEGLTKAMKSWEGITKALTATKQGLEKWSLRSVDFSYGVSHKYSNEKLNQKFMSEQGISPGLFYADQLGLFYDPSWDGFKDLLFLRPDNEKLDYRMNTSMAEYGVTDQGFAHGFNQNYSTSSGFTIPGFDLNLSGNAKYTRSWSMYRRSPPSDTTIIWPDLSFTGTFGNFADKFDFLKRRYSNVSFSSTYNYREERSFGKFSSVSEKNSVKHSFAPLGRFSITTLKNMTYEHTFNLSTEDAIGYTKIALDSSFLYITDIPIDIKGYQKDDKTNTHIFTGGYNFAYSYDLETRKGLQFWRYYIKLKNNLRLKANVGVDYRKETFTDYHTNEPEVEPETRENDHKVSVTTKPEATYNFTDNVDMLLFTKVDWSKTLVTDKQEDRWAVELHGELTVRF